MMELGITQSTNIHNTRSLIRTLKYVLDILQTEEAFTVEEYKHTHTPWVYVYWTIDKRLYNWKGVVISDFNQ